MTEPYHPNRKKQRGPRPRCPECNKFGIRMRYYSKKAWHTPDPPHMICVGCKRNGKDRITEITPESTPADGGGDS